MEKINKLLNKQSIISDKEIYIQELFGSDIKLLGNDYYGHTLDFNLYNKSMFNEHCKYKLYIKDFPRDYYTRAVLMYAEEIK